MTRVPDTFQSALQHHRAGNLREAEVLYRQLLAVQPDHVDALHMLGLLAFQLERYDIAAQLLEQAIALAPASAAIHSELAEIHRRIGGKDHLEKAVTLAQHAVELDAQSADAHYNLGVILQQQGGKNWNAAAASYRRALEINPNLPLAQYNLANILKATGHLEEAIDAYHMAIALKPDFPEALGNLGIAFYESRNLPSAVLAFNAVLKLTPNDPVAHNSLASALRDQGYSQAAIESYQRALQLQPNYAIAHNNLGKLLHDLGRLNEAVEHYRRAIAANSERAEPYQNLGMALEKLGQKREAIDMYREALTRGVASPEARYHMAAVTGGGGGIDVPEAAPAAHVVHLFDQFAATFDERLGKLNYQTPRLLHEAVVATRPAPNSLDIIDLGCGTGLCAPLFKPLARTLLGVDLSPNMIEKARERNLYDHLLVDDILTALRSRPDSFDLVLAADVFVYFGDLAALFTAARASLRPAGLLAFSVESSEDVDYALRPTRRYVHSETYLRQLAAREHFQVLTLAPGTMREEAGKPVAGFTVILQRQA